MRGGVQGEVEERLGGGEVVLLSSSITPVLFF